MKVNFRQTGIKTKWATSDKERFCYADLQVTPGSNADMPWSYAQLPHSLQNAEYSADKSCFF